MKILIIGSGGREHALGWKIKQSPLIDKIYFAPGNPGTKEIGENVSIEATNISKLSKFAKNKKIDLTVVGPETPLVLGITDAFKKEKLKIFGPSKKAAQIEGSKTFSKKLMKNIRSQRLNILLLMILMKQKIFTKSQVSSRYKS